MEQDTLSTYDSIVRVRTQLEKLDDTDPRAELHRKFWGVHMKDEETKWRATQPEHKYMDVDVDETAEEDDEDETGSGCYILEFGIPGIGRSNLWVRKEYIRVYNFCERYLNTWRGGEAPSVIITGQPGIGRSYWVRYALRRRLAEKKAVIWYRDSTLFLFVEEGVYKIPPFLSTTLKTLVWTLVDCDESPTGVPPHIAVDDTKHFIIFSTSPQPSRWKPLLKTTTWAIYIMNPWTKKEIFKAAVIHEFTDDDKQRIDEMYDQFGPTPRICFNLLKNEAQLTSYKFHYNVALHELSLEKLCGMITDTQKLSMNAASHTLLLLKRVPKKVLRKVNLDGSHDADFAHASVEPITHTVVAALQAQLWKPMPAEQLQLFRYLASVEGMKRIAGLVFELLAQSKLQEKIELKPDPTVKR